MEKFKKRLKKANRGIILGIILIIGVVIFTVIDNANFKKEKPEIETVVENFITELGNKNVLPEKYRNFKGDIPEPEKEAMMSDFSKFIDEYWVFRNQTDGFRSSELKSSYNDALNIAFESNEYLSECTMEARNIKVRKAGPNCATAEFELYSLITSTEQSEIVTPTYNESLGWYTEYSEENYEPKLSKYRLEGSYTLSLERTSDGWKIYMSDGYINSFTLVSSADN